MLRIVYQSRCVMDGFEVVMPLGGFLAWFEALCADDARGVAEILTAATIEERHILLNGQFDYRLVNRRTSSCCRSRICGCGCERVCIYVPVCVLACIVHRLLCMCTYASVRTPGEYHVVYTADCMANKPDRVTNTNTHYA